MTLFGLSSLYYWREGHRCKERAAFMGLAAYYTDGTGCMVVVADRWVPIESVRWSDLP